MSALILDFLEKVIGVVNAIEKFLFAAVMLCVFVLSFLFWGSFAKKFGKKWSLIIAFTWLIIWIPITPLIGKIPLIPPIVQGYGFGIGVVFGISAAYLFPYAILADFADKDERETSENRSGLYTGFKGLPFNIAQAIGFVTAGFMRDWTKVVGSETINVGLVWLGPICAIFILLCLPIIWKGDFDPFLKDEKVKATSIFKQIFSKKN